MSEKIFADFLWETVWAPFTFIWLFIPTSWRKWFQKIPIEMIAKSLSLIWFFVFWSLAFYSARSYLPSIYLPPFVNTGWNAIMSAPNVTSHYAGELWAQLSQLNPLSVFFGLYAQLGLIAAFFRNRPRDKNFVEKTKQVFGYERAMRGSEIIPVKELPRFLVKIFTVEEGRAANFIGMGFRVENAILTALHVLTGHEEIAVVTEMAEVIVNSNDFDGEPTEDLGILVLTDKQFSVLGVTKANLQQHAIPDGTSMFVQAYGPDGYSLGSAESNKQFGRVVYTGTTAHGFSGTPYVVHKTVVGMHLGFGVLNVGLDAAFMRMLLSNHKEDTEEWLMDEILKSTSRKKKVDFKYSPMDPDEVWVMSGGRYFQMDKQKFWSVYQTDQIDQECVKQVPHVEEKLPSFPEYNDSKNVLQAPAPMCAGAGENGKISETKCFAPTPVVDLLEQIAKLDDGMRNCLMDSLVLTHAQQSEVLTSTLQNTFVHPEGKKSQRKRHARQHLKRSLDASARGSHGLERIQ